MMTGGDSSPVLRNDLSNEVVLLELNRPERCNAFSTRLLSDLLEFLENIASDETKRIVILYGQGKIFCGGLDLRLASTGEDAEMMAKLVARVLVRIYQKMPQTVIAAVHGQACAGGAALMLASDLIVAEKGFRFGFPEVHRGLKPALLFPLLRRKLPESLLRNLLFTGMPIDAEKAFQLGIIHRLATRYQLVENAICLANEICKGEKNAVFAAKQLFAEHDDGCFEQEMEQAVQSHFASWLSPAAQEGIRAFLEKREPLWRFPGKLQ